MFGENTALSEKRGDGSGRAPAVLRDRFVLESRLDQGRLGTMYRALDRLRGQDGRPYVNILILPPELSRNAEQLAVFERELAGVCGLSHPNIVRIFDLERDGETTYLVLEWVDGESLRSVIDSLAPEAVCEADALGVVRAVGNALAYAHAHGVVHGDVRPENVLVTERGEVRLLFTSACLARTAPFEVGPRDDVRGLAALAYELMSASPPPISGVYPRGKADEPDPIEGLSRKRWKALKSALSMRDRRISSIRKLLVALDLPEPRAPRRGSRPDRIRDSKRSVLKRVAIAAGFCAGIGALLVGGARIWNDPPDGLTDLSVLPATVGSGAERAADATREGLSGARERLERAGTALAGLWNEIGQRVGGAREAVSDETPSSGGSSAGDADPAGSAADNTVSTAKLVKREELAAGVGELDTGELDTGELETAEPDTGEVNAGELHADGGDLDVVDTPSQVSAGGSASAPSADEAEPTDDVRAPAERHIAVANAGEPASAREPASAGETANAGEPASAGEPANAGEGAGADVQPDRGVAFSGGEYVVSERDGVAAVEVERDDPRGDVSFVWWTRAGSAMSGDDYADLGRRVEQLRDGETARVLYVPITSDSIVEDREQFEIYVGVLSDEGRQNGALDTAQVTIIDDDR